MVGGAKVMAEDHKNNNQQLTLNQTALMARSLMAATAGLEFNGERDYYDTLGYEEQPSFQDYYTKYRRQDIAARIVEAPVRESWRTPPKVTDDKDDDKKTSFEKQWEKLVKRLRVFHYMKRADKLAGIGQLGVLFIGVREELPDQLADQEENSNRIPSDQDQQVDLSTEMPKMNGPEDVLYLSPYAQGSVEIKEWEVDPSNPRYGRPKIYEIDLAGKLLDNANRPPDKREVHWSRVIHIAENLDEDDVYGTPRMEKALNRLHDLVKVIGGGAESFWREAKGILQFDMDSEASMDPDDKDGLKDQIDEMYHNLRRYLTTKGMDVNKLGSEIANPENHFNTITKLISAATNIPVRILLGSERGELASGQDETNWLSYIEEREHNFVEPVILRAFIDRLQEYGALEAVEYEVKWEDLFKLNEQEQAKVVKTKAEAANELMTGAAGNIVDVIKVLEDELDFPVLEELKQALQEQREKPSGGFGSNEIDETDPEVQEQWEKMRNSG